MSDIKTALEQWRNNALVEQDRITHHEVGFWEHVREVYIDGQKVYDRDNPQSVATEPITVTVKFVYDHVEQLS